MHNKYSLLSINFIWDLDIEIIKEIINKEKLFTFLNMLDNRIKQNPKIKADMTETLLRNINNIFTRAELTEQELNSLYGIVNLLTNKE